MKIILVLINKKGLTEVKEWGCIPAEFYLPDYDSGGIVIYQLAGKEMKGHLWWKKIYAYYKEEENKGIVESNDPEYVLNLRATDNAESVQDVLFGNLPEQAEQPEKGNRDDTGREGDTERTDEGKVA